MNGKLVSNKSKANKKGVWFSGQLRGYRKSMGRPGQEGGRLSRARSIKGFISSNQQAATPVILDKMRRRGAAAGKSKGLWCLGTFGPLPSSSSGLMESQS
ncbi:hypothetical protein CPLU01_04495 [Colletotrichum plurivorum]|uniref:Uncharacterized protein n=1 Tax=Colletotrichum plurivorum TaxID=2175906 RepID=A0A8H6NJU1_9PEZI|nr:hypothetical protein CPLU01_04495 [Colletotrichum plurivorum]